MLFLGMHLDRIAKAVLPLKHENKRNQYLKALLSGNLNFFERKESMAKSFLWELEVWSWLREKTKNVELEEPDITVNYNGSFIAIACKKFYSERHVQNVLSQGVKQIERGHEFGIVAINLDELLPEDKVLKGKSLNAAKERLLKNNEEFLDNHNRHLARYFSANRLISAIVSTSAIIDIPSEKPRFRNMYQRVIWEVSELSTRHREQLHKFYNTVMN